MKRVRKQLSVAMTACIAVFVGALVPAPQPASAGHVCSTSVTTPGWDWDKAFIIAGDASYGCGSREMKALHVEATLEAYSTRTGRWEEISKYAATYTNVDQTPWVTALFDCAGLSLSVRTKGRGMAFFFSSFTDEHVVRSGTNHFHCSNGGGGQTIPA